jgi:hypothetical protein
MSMQWMQPIVHTYIHTLWIFPPLPPFIAGVAREENAPFLMECTSSKCAMSGVGPSRCVVVTCRSCTRDWVHLDRQTVAWRHLLEQILRAGNRHVAQTLPGRTSLSAAAASVPGSVSAATVESCLPAPRLCTPRRLDQSWPPPTSTRL